jgi:hypothetical protein
LPERFGERKKGELRVQEVINNNRRLPMNSRMKTGMLACVLTGWASCAAAQECNAKISTIDTVADIQAALGCVEDHVNAEAARSRQLVENNKKQLLQQITEQIELVTTNMRHVSFKESTNGAWKQIPDSAEADACFLSSVRLPPQGLCQITYQGTLEHWAYNVSDPVGAGFVCTATCVWMDLRRKPEGAAKPEAGKPEAGKPEAAAKPETAK